MEKKINRRDFLRIAGGAGAALTTAAATRAGTAAIHWAEGNNTAGSSPMTLRDVAGTGQPVSLLGYGGMRWPETTNGEGGRVVDQEKVNTLIDYAMKHGVNYYDTAPVYHRGQSERVMGKALARYPRNSFFVATKLSNFNPGEWTLEASKKIYEHSFSELGVDYIDFYLLHSLGAGKDAFMKRFVDNGVLDFLVKEREAGRIKRLGFSFHGDRESFLTALNYDVKWDFVQIQMNYHDWMEDSDKRPSARYLYTELEKRKIPVVVMEPLLGGRLAKLNDKLLAELKRRDPDQSPASWAFRFVGTQPQVQTILSGMTYMEHLVEDVNIFSPLKPLDDEQQHFLEETAVAMMKYPTIPCTACKYCMPCPFGVDIPGNFAYFNKCLLEGNVPASRQSEGYARARQNFLGDFAKSVAEKQQSSHCTACGHCVPLCPQHIKIPDQMKRINQLVAQLKNNA